jgi:hypothetical protein
MPRPTRKELFSASKKPTNTTVIPSTVVFRHDKKKGRLKPLAPREKMVVALKRILAKMSDEDAHGCRYYVDNNKIQVMREPTGSAAKEGERQTFRAAGRCRVGVCHPHGTKTSKIIQFDISFRDTRDDRGLDDIEWVDPSVIEELPKNTPIDVSAFA